MTGSSATVGALWRYPVKSFQGFEVDTLELTEAGVVGDRTHGLVDAADGRLLSAKRVGALLGASATDRDLTLPDGTVVALDHPEADVVLSAWLDRPVRLARAGTTGDVSYQMTFDPPDDEAEYYDIPTPSGSFLDLAPVHLVSTATLAAGVEARPDLDWDVRRFRPNVVVAVDGPAFAEHEWIGHHVRMGDAVLAVRSPTVRCAMPLRPQPGLPRQPELFRAMSDLNETFPNHLGLYLDVVSGGTITTGDPVTPLRS